MHSRCALPRYLPTEIAEEVNKKFYDTLKKARAGGGGGGGGSGGGTEGADAGTAAAAVVVGNGLGAAQDPAEAAEGDDIYSQCVCRRLYFWCLLRCGVGEGRVLLCALWLAWLLECSTTT